MAGRRAVPKLEESGLRARLAKLRRARRTHALRVQSADLVCWPTEHHARGAPEIGAQMAGLLRQISQIEDKVRAVSRNAAASGQSVPAAPAPPVGHAATVRAARRLNRAAGLLATSVLLDSALEHY